MKYIILQINKLLILLLVLPFLSYGSENYYDSIVKNGNSKVINKPIGEGCITTLDIAVNEMTAKDSFVFDYDYSVRTQGIQMSVYYSGVTGNTQWFDFPSPTKIILMPKSIHIPINSWVDDGLPVDAGKIVRIVLSKDTEC